ncbi:MAG: MAPEG family protein [Hyphomonadaceae bacterium]|nr:MAPEG family protein [Hyphomonadaceae bacterium]
MVRLEIAALYAGANIFILLALAFSVVQARRRYKVVLGDGDNPAVLRAVRAHGNAAEYIPAGIAGLTLLALLDPAAPLWLLHAAGAALTLGRALHGIGLSVGEVNAGRVLGTLLTWIAFALLGGGLIYAGLAQAL